LENNGHTCYFAVAFSNFCHGFSNLFTFGSKMESELQKQGKKVLRIGEGVRKNGGRAKK